MNLITHDKENSFELEEAGKINTKIQCLTKVMGHLCFTKGNVIK